MRRVRVFLYIAAIGGLSACEESLAPVVVGAFGLPQGTQAYVSTRTRQGVEYEESDRDHGSAARVTRAIAAPRPNGGWCRWPR